MPGWMLLSIIVAVIVLSLLVLALAARALAGRLQQLQAEQEGLVTTMARAQELAETASGLQAHADALQVRAELIQNQLAAMKGVQEPAPAER